jgi:nitrite reductase/ring-hydroxylating ferredoxin subunit
MMELKVGEGK